MVTYNPIREFIHKLPKVELHVHLEGTLEPDLILKFAERNHIVLQYKSTAEIERAFNFNDLASFLEVYFEATKVLVREEDFYELTMNYFCNVAAQNVRHVELFFDPQAHTERGIPFETVVKGISRALKDGEERYHITSRLIMCFYRHLSEVSAFSVLEAALPYKSLIFAVGLDSSEDGNPPEKFQRVFERARAEGFLAVSHAWEGPVDFIWQTLDILKVSRIDHGIRCLEDMRLTERLVSEHIPLTVCPISNVKLKAYARLSEHPIKAMMDRGIVVTINSDDPAFFKVYIEDVYFAVQETFRLDIKALYQLAQNAVSASFMTPIEQHKLRTELEAVYRDAKLEQRLVQLDARVAVLERRAEQQARAARKSEIGHKVSKDVPCSDSAADNVSLFGRRHSV